jgi:fructoselysine-6-P-deglycase FrlB-like protein
MLSALKMTGLELIQREISRQKHDALDSFAAASTMAGGIAVAARVTDRLTLLGMGASHYANRIVEGEYRRLGIEAQAVVLSEALYAPLAARERTVLIVSQSGASGEVSHYLQHPKRGEARYGLTLDPSSPLAKAIPCLIGQGGVELGFAATRSLFVTLALHASVLDALGGHLSQQIQTIDNEIGPKTATEIRNAVQHLLSADVLLLSGRAYLQGLAEVTALHIAELARVPALALEGGQLAHGPLELLRPGVGVVLFRAAGQTAGLTAALAGLCLKAGVRPVVFDASGETSIPEAITVQLGALEGVIGAMKALVPVQRFLLEFAASRVPRVGEPLRSHKVTAEPGASLPNSNAPSLKRSQSGKITQELPKGWKVS